MAYKPTGNKPGRPKKVHAGGRPTKMTKNVVAKLEECYALDCTDKEACLLADISVDALYKYQKKYPEFVKRKQQLKETPVFIARKTVVKNIKEDQNLAFKYLERKRRDEFGPSERIDHNVKVGIELSEEEAGLAKEAVDYVRRFKKRNDFKGSKK